MIEYTEWQQKSREIPDEDQTGFYDVALRHIEIFRYETDQFSLPPHRTHFSLKFTLKGREEYFFNRRRVSLEAGGALFANDGEEHASSVSERAESVSIFIPTDQAQTLLRNVGTAEESLLNEPDNSPMDREIPQVAFQPSRATEKLLQAYLKECRRSPGISDCEALESSALSLTAHALSDLFTVAPPWSLQEVVKNSVRDELITRVLRARTFIDDHAGKAYDLEELSQIACLSKYHLIRTFSEIVGETPGAYARRCRLNRARQAIEEGDDWTRVARGAGYASVRRFREAYIKQFGPIPA